MWGIEMTHRKMPSINDKQTSPLGDEHGCTGRAPPLQTPAQPAVSERFKDPNAIGKHSVSIVNNSG